MLFSFIGCILMTLFKFLLFSNMDNYPYDNLEQENSLELHWIILAALVLLLWFYDCPFIISCPKILLCPKFYIFFLVFQAFEKGRTLPPPFI